MDDSPTPEISVLEPPAARSALDPLRRRLVGALRERPDSASGLARRLGESRQRLNYHLRALEEAGVVELSEERPRGNFVERVLRPTARHFLVDPTLLGSLSPEPADVQDRFSASYLTALAARTVGEVGRLRERADATGKRLATVAMESEVALARPADLESFANDLAKAIAGVIADHHDPDAAGARPFRLVVGAYPARKDESERGEER
ncbi:MAG: winged helix-turn-helix domain-containing protein [Gemmatimonadota bacterium]|nr:winged helix-turn-helix domain-containing protein [Gemmatimonadota bacterium]